MKNKNVKYSILNTKKRRFGVTLVELMVTILIAMLVFAGIGVFMVDSIRAFPRMYERTTGNYQRADAGVIPDSYVARATFDSVVRKASIKSPSIPYVPSSTVTLYYYNDVTSPALDRCARFRFDSTNNTLLIDYGTYVDATKTETYPAGSSGRILAKNVTNATFEVQGTSMIMGLTIDNAVDPANPKQKVKMTVTSAAVRHNE
jgi:hypothetical protein